MFLLIEPAKSSSFLLFFHYYFVLQEDFQFIREKLQ